METYQSHYITILPSGYGHWKVTFHNYRGKDRTFTTNDSQAIDDYNSEEKDGRIIRKRRGYLSLKDQLKNNL